jgi:catechol 2,3-dioxygenase-like lactoylglutathione lyase family enzyme
MPAIMSTNMLGNKDAAANIAVKNLEVAKRFYKETLGLREEEAEVEGVIVFRSGNSTIFVYQSEYAGTNKATAVTWMVGGEMEDIVQTLRSKGVTFEHYDMPDAKREGDGDIYVFGDMKVAWFKDPDGNILNIANQ